MSNGIYVSFCRAGLTSVRRRGTLYNVSKKKQSKNGLGVFGIRVSKELRELINEAAAADDRDPSVWARLKLRDAAARRLKREAPKR